MNHVSVAVADCPALAYRNYVETTVHLYADCPGGKLIGIARREAVTGRSKVEGLELCEWCGGRAFQVRTTTT